MLLGSVALGLAYLQLPVAPLGYESAEFETRADAAPDLWAESRRSRAILEAQEGRPPSLLPLDIPLAGSRRAPDTVLADIDVIDGDTFRMGTETIRIADIDTPEMDGRCASERALARRAAERLSTLLDSGPVGLSANPDGRDEDRYGRKLRIVSTGQGSVGDTLVAEGLARRWTGRRLPWCG